MTRFLVTETCEWIVHAQNEEEAEAIWLDKGEAAAEFVGVPERFVQTADLPGTSQPE